MDFADSVISDGIRAVTQTKPNTPSPSNVTPKRQTLSKTLRNVKWSKPGLIAGLTLVMLSAVAGIVISVLAVFKPERVEHHVRVSQSSDLGIGTPSVNRVTINGSLICDNDFVVSKNSHVTQASTVNQTTVVQTLETSKLSVGGIELTSSLLRSINTFREYIQVGNTTKEYTWKTGSELNVVLPNSDVFTAANPWVLLGGNPLWYYVPPFVNTAEKTVSFVDLTPGTWTIVFQGRYIVDNGSNQAVVSPSLVMYTKEMKNVLTNGITHTDAVMLRNEIQDNVRLTELKDANSMMSMSATVQIPVSNPYTTSSATRPMVEFAIITKYAHAPVKLYNLTLTCIKLN